MVNLMENKNQGLDSIERRRALVDLLKIPPALLGLSSLSEMADSFIETTNTATGKNKKIYAEGTIVLYKNALNAYNNLHIQGTSISLINDLETFIEQLKRNIDNCSSKLQKTELLYVLWEFYRLLNDIYMYDVLNWNSFYKNINGSLSVAKELNDANLYALTMHQSCGSRILQNNGNLAKIEIDAALSQLRNASSIVQSVVYAQAAKAYSLGDTDLGDKMSARTFIEKSQDRARQITMEERYIPQRVDAAKYLFTQLDALMSLNNVADALSLVDEIELHTESNNTRNSALLNLKRAGCCVSLRRPEYEAALKLVGEAFKVYKSVGSKYNLKEIEKIYRAIATSPYGNSPEVVELGQEIKDSKRGQRR